MVATVPDSSGSGNRMCDALVGDEPRGGVSGWGVAGGGVAGVAGGTEPLFVDSMPSISFFALPRLFRLRPLPLRDFGEVSWD